MTVAGFIAAAGVSLIAASVGTGAPVVVSACVTRPPTTVSPVNGRLWTVNHRGRFVAREGYVNPDGSMWLKAPWWAAGPKKNPSKGPHGKLVVTGRRVDAPAPPLRARTTPIWQEGYRGSGMWAVVLTFPTEG